MNFVSGTWLDRCRAALLVSAAAYLLLLPTGALSFWRSLAFATSAVLAVVVTVALARSRREAIPAIGVAIPVAIVAWAVWSIASLAWSVDPGFSAQEVKGDVLWGLVTMAIFYVAATTTQGGFGALAGTLLAGLAFWTALAVGFAMSAGGWDARPFHRGEGAFATYLVTVSPFVALLLWRPPAGLASGPRSLAVAILLIALVLISARLSDNRILWVAFAASVIVIAAGARVAQAWKAGAAALLIVVFALLFVDAVRQRAEQVSPADGSVTTTIATDPRIAIWKHATDRIRARPWQGYGYGLHILGGEIGADTGDRRIMHPHNLFVSQWLQTGAIGLALFLLMLATVAARYGRFIRSSDIVLTRLGAIGLAVLAAFVIRNLTDDFFIRANGKILFAANAILLALGALRLREMRRHALSAGGVPATAEAR
jgi:O-antigen ligase